MGKIVIIGSGPAGVSAALYTARARMETVVFTMGPGALGKAHEIENYYGFAEAVSGQELEQAGIRGAERLGVSFLEEEVVGVYYLWEEEAFQVKTTKGSHRADCVILATGTSRLDPPLPDLETLVGKGVSYCAVCDGFFYRKKDVLVYGNGDYAVHEALELKNLAKTVTIVTDGQPMRADVPAGIRVDTRKIAGLIATETFEGVRFEDGTTLEAQGLFIAYGIAGSAALAKKIGAVTEGNSIVVDEGMATNVPGLYAAGDCTGGMLQIAKAVYEGAKAGTEAVRFLRGREKMQHG